MSPLDNISMTDIVSLLESRNIEFVSFDGWKILDNHEKEAGKKDGRPRLKVTSIEKMLEIIRKNKNMI